MGQNESKVSLCKSECECLRQLLKIRGQVAVEEFIEKTINRWKSEIFKLAVIGRPATGKSSFINVMRSVGPNDIDVVSENNNEAELHLNYDHLVGKQIVWKELQLDDMHNSFCEFDYFLIFFDNVINEKDYWIITKVQAMEKPYSLIRSKIDIDIDNCKFDSYNTTDVIPNIRVKIDEDLNLSTYHLNSNSVFLISSRDKSLGDTAHLQDFMKNNLQMTVIIYRFDIVLRALANAENKRRMIRIGLSTATAAAVWALIYVPVRSINVVCSVVPPIITVFVVNRLVSSFFHNVTENTLIFKNYLITKGLVPSA